MPGIKDAFTNAMNQGHSAAWDQNWEEAVRCYRIALTESPDDLQALTSLALALTEMQDLDAALHCYLKATKVDPGDPVILTNLAKIYERMGRVSDAIPEWNKAADLYLKDKLVDQALDGFMHAIVLQPANLSARLRLATILDQLGRKKEASEEYLNVASIFQQTGDIQKALQSIDYVLKMNPGFPEAEKARETLRAGQQLPPAQRPRGGTGPMNMAKVRSLDDGNGDEQVKRDPVDEALHKALVKLAGHLFLQETSEEGQGQLSKRGLASLARGTGGLSADHSARARMQLHLSKAIDSQTQAVFDQAAVELERAIESGLKAPEAYFDMGFLLFETDPDKSLRFLQQSLRHPDFRLASYLLIAQIHHKRGMLAEAVKEYLGGLALADASVIDPEQSNELLQLYEVIVESQAQISDQEQLRTLCETLSDQLLRKDWREFLLTAREQLPPTLPGNPPLPVATMLIETKGGKVVESLANVRQLSDEGRLRSAMEVAFDSIASAPTYLPLHAQMAEVLAKEGRLQDAVDKIMVTSVLYDLRGETAQAIQLLTRGSQIAPMDIAIRSKLIDYYKIQGRTEAALQQFLDLGNVYYQLAELDMSKQALLSGLKLAQESKGMRDWIVKFLAKIADIDVQRFDWRNAIRMLEQLRTLKPEDSTTRAQLIDLHIKLGQMNMAVSELSAYLSLMENTGRLAEAIRFAQEINTEHPDQLELREVLADLLIHNNKIKEAVKELEVILKINIEEGNNQRVAATLQRLITVDPQNADRYQQLLQETYRKKSR